MEYFKTLSKSNTTTSIKHESQGPKIPRGPLGSGFVLQINSLINHHKCFGFEGTVLLRT